MESKEILIFDIKGEFGHFRKYNTTTSPLTYSIPTRTAIAGMLGAIIGAEREIRDGVFPEGSTPVQELFSKSTCDIAIQIVQPIKKVNIGFNLVNTKTSFFDLTRAGRTQIEFELLKDVHYRIYFSSQDSTVFKNMTDRIIQKRHHFTPYLGLAQFTATIDFYKSATAGKVSVNDIVNIATAVNMSKIIDRNVRFEKECFYSVNNMPIEMNAGREVQEYSDVLIEKTGKPVSVKVSEYYQIDGIGNILFL